MKTSSMQLVSALELLVSNTRHLLRRDDVTENEVTSAIQEKIISARSDLATELIILLHVSVSLKFHLTIPHLHCTIVPGR